MFDLTTIGEGQIRLTVPHGQRLARAGQLSVTSACSEANVAGLLAQLGHTTSWCTKMPEGDLAERCLSEFRSVGVDMSNIVRAPDGRVALYFMEPGQYPMPSKVVYDRMDTPFRGFRINEINWSSMLDTSMIFVTGITAALTPATADLVTHFVEQAAARDIDIALDVNFRSLLWSPKEAQKALTPIAALAKVIFCSLRDAEIVFGLDGTPAERPTILRDRFKAQYVVSTDQIDGVHYAGPDGTEHFTVEVVPVVDRPGAGDSFVAGTLHGMMQGNLRTGIKYGQRIAKYSLTHHGDLTYFGPDDLVTHGAADIIR